LHGIEAVQRHFDRVAGRGSGLADSAPAPVRFGFAPMRKRGSAVRVSPLLELRKFSQLGWEGGAVTGKQRCGGMR